MEQLHTLAYVAISNHERWSAALTVAERAGAVPEDVGVYLTLLGLAEESETGWSAIGAEDDITWWQERQLVSLGDDAGHGAWLS